MSNHRGMVFDNVDPLDLGRLRLLVPAVLGSEPTGWAEPVVPPAKTFKPAIGDVMWVFFENEDLNKPIYSSTAEITAAMLEATMILTSEIIVGDPNAEHFELNATQVIATDVNNQIVFNLSPGADTFFQLTDSTGDTVAAINSDGSAAFNNLDLSGIFTIDSDSMIVDGDTLADVINAPARGMVVYGSRTPVITGITSEFGLMEVDWTSDDDSNDRWYMIGVSMTINPQNTGDPIPYEVRVRFTTNGDVPDINSQLLRSWVGCTAAGYSEDILLEDRWQPGFNDTEFKFLITVECLDGFQITAIQDDVEFWLTDVGPDPIPNKGKKNTGDGSAGSGSGGGGDSGGDPPQGQQHFTRTFYAQWGATYNGSGNQIGGGSNLTQGYYSGTNGNQKAACGFDSSNIMQALNNATITKVELYLYANHWFYNGGGLFVLGFHGHTGGAPATWDGIENKFPDREHDMHFAKPGGRWVDITDWAPSGWATGDKTGILFGPGPTNDWTYYGAFNGPAQMNKPQLRITYTK